MTIGIDMMGGDFAPLEAVKGINLFLSNHNIPPSLLLIGDKEQVESLLAEHKVPVANIKVVHAEPVSYTPLTLPTSDIV